VSPDKVRSLEISGKQWEVTSAGSQESVWINEHRTKGWKDGLPHVGHSPCLSCFSGRFTLTSNTAANLPDENSIGYTKLLCVGNFTHNVGVLQNCLP